MKKEKTGERQWCLLLEDIGAGNEVVIPKKEAHRPWMTPKKLS